MFYTLHRLLVMHRSSPGLANQGRIGYLKAGVSKDVYTVGLISNRFSIGPQDSVLSICFLVWFSEPIG